MTGFTIEKVWDGNERVTEGRNGRIYTSAGRWQWVVSVDGAVDSTHNTQRDAKHRAASLTACPECGGPLQRIADGLVAVPYAPTFHVRGAKLPIRLVARPFLACSMCEFCTDKGVK